MDDEFGAGERREAAEADESSVVIPAGKSNSRGQPSWFYRYNTKCYIIWFEYVITMYNILFMYYYIDCTLKIHVDNIKSLF